MISQHHHLQTLQSIAVKIAPKSNSLYALFRGLYDSCLNSAKSKGPQGTGNLTMISPKVVRATDPATGYFVELMEGESAEQFTMTFGKLYASETALTGQSNLTTYY